MKNYFKDQQYWEFDGFVLKDDSPKNISKLGFPTSVRKINSAINWFRESTTNKWTTFFTEDGFFTLVTVFKITNTTFTQTFFLESFCE